MFQNAAPELEKCIGQARRAEGIKPGVQRIETPGGHELVIKQAPERGDGSEGPSQGVPRISATPDGVRILRIKSRSSLRSLRALFPRASGAYRTTRLEALIPFRPRFLSSPARSECADRVAGRGFRSPPRAVFPRSRN